MRRKSRSQRNLERLNTPKNLQWGTINRLITRLGDLRRSGVDMPITERERKFIADLYGCGPNYAMTDAQINWLNRIERKLWR